MTNKAKPTNGKVVEFPAPLLCSRCKKPIPKGSKYLNFARPDGTTTPIHIACLGAGESSA